MNSDQKNMWLAVDQYFESTVFDEADFLKAARKASSQAKLPEIAVTAAHGKLLAFLVQLSGAKRILELGTLGGYSTLWMAQALGEGGEVITLEHNPVCAGVARANFAHAGYEDVIELRYGEALDHLKALIGEKRKPFDFIFIDANKSDYPIYLDYCLRLAEKGTLIVVDNIVRDGQILDSQTSDMAAQGIRAFHQKAGEHSRLDVTPLQVVGGKGYDGLSLLRVIK